MVREEIKKILNQALKKLNWPQIPFTVERPSQSSYGDYATNLALLLKKDPQEMVALIKSPLFQKIEIKNNFINFFLSESYLQQQVSKILKEKEKFGQLKIGRGQKINLEFISANPTGPLTVGNGRGGPFGDVLARVLRQAGFLVKTAYYVNDYGQQILALGHSVLKDKEAVYQGAYIDELSQKIKGKDAAAVGSKAAKYILEKMIKKTIQKMGFHFDEWVYESKLHQTGLVDKVIQLLKKKNLIYEKDGAWWFKSTAFGDQRDRVLIKQNGQKTYLAGDLAYHWYKFKIKKYQQAINIWGADHSGDVAGLQAGLTALGLKNKLTIILLQFVTLFQKEQKLKMSKRAGIYVTLDELLNEIPADVIKFFFLQKSADTHLNFDLDLAREQSEKNPVYYIQYAYARICSIIRKSKIKNQKSKLSSANYQLLRQPSELALIKQLIRLPEIVEDVAKDYQVQRLPQYALDLATVFHQFYRDCYVLTDDQALSQARLALVLATQIVLKKTLNLMNIHAPEKM